MNTDTLKTIKEEAWNKFPAQELWINKDTETFWAYEEKQDTNKLYLTTGLIVDKSKLVFDTIYLQVSNMSRFITQLCRAKQNSGYECFAIQMRE
jgi:hypothetical protein